MSKTKKQPLENLNAALSDVPSNAHEGEPEKPTKKPRTESPETLALRAHRTRRQILDRIKAESDRAHERANALQGELERHDAECEALPEPVRVILSKLRGDL